MYSLRLAKTALTKIVDEIFGRRVNVDNAVHGHSVESHGLVLLRTMLFYSISFSLFFFFVFVFYTFIFASSIYCVCVICARQKGPDLYICSRINRNTKYNKRMNRAKEKSLNDHQKRCATKNLPSSSSLKTFLLFIIVVVPLCFPCCIHNM